MQSIPPGEGDAAAPVTVFPRSARPSRSTTALRLAAMGLVLAAISAVGPRANATRRQQHFPAGLPRARAEIVAAPPGNLVVILLDTLRPDHLGAWGYGKGTSPAIDALARRGIVFENARSVAPWTAPTIATIFQGQFPFALLAPSEGEVAGFGPLPPAPATLAEKMRGAGLHSFALSDHPGLRGGEGFARGFDEWSEFQDGSGRRPAPAPTGMRPGGFDVKTPPAIVSARFEHALAAAAGQRFFAWLHLMYPHPPLQAGPRWGAPPDVKGCGVGARRRDALVAAYDAEVRRADWTVGRIEQALDAAGRADDTWIVLVSDHGEAFWEHGTCGHGNSLFDEQLRVVLLVVPPRGTSFTPGRVAAPVSLVDLHPTLLDLAGVPAGEVDGRSLLRLLRPAGDDAAGPSFAEHARFANGRDLPVNPLAAAVVDPPWKLLRDPGDPASASPRLFDVAADPGEKRDLAADREDVTSRLSDALRIHVEAQAARRASAVAPPAPAPLSPETRERLRELGYVP